ncbi:MAG: hypothetical protein ACI39U_02020 [Candidatus Cryptobacteroides sp.]
MPATYSPEYGVAEDCNYELALLRWGCQALLESCRILNLEDSLIPKWEDVLDRLADFPQGQDGMELLSYQNSSMSLIP